MMDVRLLLIDDRPFDRELTTRALDELARPPGPATVLAVANWEEASAHLECERFDLILLDLHLPKIDGLDILRRLEKEAHPPVIMITDEDDVSIAIESLRRGAWDYVPKTGDWGLALCRRVESALVRFRMEQQLAEYQRSLRSRVVDLEEQVEARTQRIRAQATEIEQLCLKVEDSARLREDIFANVSHEFRTPLNAILGFAQLIESDVGGTVSPKVAEMLRIVCAQGRELLRRVDALLGIARARKGRCRVTCSRFSVQSFLEELRAETVALERSNELEIRWSGPPTPCEVMCDRVMLRAIAYELVRNSIKFTPAGRIEVGLEPGPDDGVRLTVMDSGIGIPAELREAVFEDFRQADGSSTRSYGGLGLGLGIVKRYVALLGGTLSLTGEPRSGTTFEVLLPGKAHRERRYVTEGFSSPVGATPRLPHPRAAVERIA